MIRSQNFDQIRMGLQTAKDNALNVKGSYAVVGLVSAEAKKSLAPSDEFQPSSANSSAGSLQTDFARKVGFAGEARDTTVQTLQTTLASIDDLGLPAGETRSLKDAINGALAEDRLGVFEQMQLKASLRTVEAAKLQRATDAAKASELRHGRVEGNLNHALDALTSLEMVYGNDEVDVQRC